MLLSKIQGRKQGVKETLPQCISPAPFSSGSFLVWPPAPVLHPCWSSPLARAPPPPPFTLIQRWQWLPAGLSLWPDSLFLSSSITWATSHCIKGLWLMQEREREGNWEWFPKKGFPGGSAGKESTCNAGDLSLIPGLGSSLGEGKRYPFQYSGLENSMDCIVHGVTKSQT